MIAEFKMNRPVFLTGFTPLEITYTHRKEFKTNRPVFLTGFTLIEISVAFFIFISVITSSLLALNRGLSLIQTARNINIASSDLRRACEDLRREVDNTGTIIPTSYQLNNINSTETVSVSADTTHDPIVVNALVSWQDESQSQRSVYVDMLLSQRKP